MGSPWSKLARGRRCWGVITSSGATFGAMARAVQSGIGVFDGEPLEVRRARIETHLSEQLGLADPTALIEFLGEQRRQGASAAT